jgi:dUTP pyrophosphatase
MLGDERSEELTVLVERVDPNSQIPRRLTSHSAGYDVQACLAGRRVDVIRKSFGPSAEIDVVSFSPSHAASLELNPGDRALIPLGFRLSVRPGYMTLLFPRSGRAWKEGLTLANSIGLIDADYAEECMAIVVNQGHSGIVLSHGDRIGQLVFVAHATASFVESEVRRTTTREGGFESTGR